MSFWLEREDDKKRYLVTYIKRTQERYNIRDVQLSHLLTLSEELLSDNFIAYFETLPSNFKKSFKSAWRQKEHKEKARDNYTSKVTLELTQDAHLRIRSLISYVSKHNDEINNASLTKSEKIEKSIDYVIRKIAQLETELKILTERTRY